MCGIIGYISRSQKSTDVLKKIIYQSKIRGLHSFGGVIKLNGELICEKFNSIHSLLDWIPDKIDAGIFHCRYSTSGDYLDKNNNQPICIDDRYIVFNGVIDMGTKDEMQKNHSINMFSENDAEIILHKCKSDADLQDYVTNMKGSFSGLLMDHNAITFARNCRRPAHISDFNDVYIASTRDIFIRAGIEGCREIDPLKIKHWNI